MDTTSDDIWVVIATLYALGGPLAYVLVRGWEISNGLKPEWAMRTLACTLWPLLGALFWFWIIQRFIRWAFPA